MRKSLLFSLMLATPLALSVITVSCGGFTSQPSDPAAADATSNTAPEASSETDGAVDGGFGAPVLVRRAPPGQLLAVRPNALGTDFFTSEGTIDQQFMYRSASAGNRGERIEVTDAGGPLFGLAPTPLTIGGTSIIVYGTIGYLSQARIIGTIADSRIIVDTKIDGGGGSYPYVIPNGTALYFSAYGELYRCVFNIFSGCASTTVLTIRSSDSTPVANPNFAVVSPDEQTLYFAGPGLTSLSRIWVATRATSASNEVVFEHAEPLAFPDSDKNDSPMWVSPDGKLIYFVRSEAGADGGTDAIVYSISRP